tara:strand:- start:393 stop:632 length:240 start_codon:yes stop_codon:yes gene_type:complete
MDVKQLTLGEVTLLEELSGLSINSMSEDDKPKGRFMAAFAYVVHRRTDPKFTFEKANKLTMIEAQELVFGNAEPEEVKN